MLPSLALCSMKPPPPMPLDCGSTSVSTATIATAASAAVRSEEHTSELQSLMRNSYAVFCLKKKKHTKRREETKCKLIKIIERNKKSHKSKIIKKEKYTIK